MTTAVAPASLLDRKLEAAFHVLVTALSSANEQRIVGWMLANSTTVKRAVATVLVPGSETKPAVDWTRIPIAMEPDEWTRSERRDANIRALVHLQELTGRPVGSTTPKEAREKAELMRATDPAAYARSHAILSRFSGWGGVVSNTSEAEKLRSRFREMGGMDESLPTSWRNVLDEYFTPTWFATAVWKLIARLHDLGYVVSNPQVLESSAGLGRFIATAPAGIDWAAVELSPRSGEILAFLHPEVDLCAPMSFQSFMGDFPPPPDGDMDLAVCNPPYGVNPERKKDTESGYTTPGKKGVSVPNELVPYFLLATARRLRPGGVMVQLVTLGVAKGEKNKRLRENLCRSCHWLAAWAPPQDM